jgi:anaerobic dimethyl sulfoxide reductase subunit B (iron-sulfur subunit)
MAYAFYFDARFCSGCKACQVACKDHNHLPIGLLWRRVYEIVGGGWQENGGAWTQDVFAYNLSIACNHCAKPICVEVCPASAITVRPDGIVLLNSDLCIGCRLCSWACPYSAPQYDADAGYMTKCNFCIENIEAGIPPACVSACPMRVLDYGDRDKILSRHPNSSQVYPLPHPEHTNPSLSITPHHAVQRPLSGEANLGNREEVYQP